MIKRKNGFTLAEVLITLSIIGVVAVLTIPGLVQKYEERVRVTQLKKVYTQLNQAFQMAVIEHGPVKTWGLTTTHVGYDEEGNSVLDASGQVLFCNYLGKYLKKSSVNTINYDNKLSLDGRIYSRASSVTINQDEPISMILADGTCIALGWIWSDCARDGVNACGDIAVTLPSKTSILGKTFFYFRITPYGIIPEATINNTAFTFPEYCDVHNKNGATSTEQGRGCTAWVIEKGNMDYLHCDDLSWDGKNKCD